MFIRLNNQTEHLFSSKSIRRSISKSTPELDETAKPDIKDYSRPHSSLSGSSSYQGGRPWSATLQSSQSMRSLRPSWSPSAASPDPEPHAPPRNSAITAGLIWEAQKQEQKLEYETNSSIVTPAMCDSKLGNPHPCDLAVLQQIEEEVVTDKEL
ncbi:LIM domain only 7 isoform X4 [Labeo rohita]|uniref:LIM domain only 7 isoform X4 n=1 Tax=Labeo rohita TaxID=84645 RepID=A0A498NZY9_LABRO|nr:LIM domain only 7 isoform X4 [Labeo rohita]